MGKIDIFVLSLETCKLIELIKSLLYLPSNHSLYDCSGNSLIQCRFFPPIFVPAEL